jgi:hypothetical protein
MGEYDQFLDILTQLEEEKVKTEELYTEIKTHYDEVKLNSRRMQGSLSFLSKQAENLIQLRNAQTALIKASLDTKHKAFGNDIKTKSLQIKQDNDDDGVPFKVVKYLIDSLNMSSNQIIGLDAQDAEIIPITEEDRLLELRIAQEGISGYEDLTRTVPVEIDESTIELVCDEMGTYHVIANGCIICDDDYDLPEGTANFDIGKHGELKATNEDGNSIKIIRSELLRTK